MIKGKYYQLCYRFNEERCISDRTNPRIWNHGFVVLNFISKKLKFILNKFDIRDVSILDVGCGYEPYKKLFDFKSYTGVDFFNNQRAEIKHNLNNELKLEKKYNIILCMDVMEHVKNTENLIKTFKNNLNPSSLLFISIPFGYGIHGSPYDYVRFTKNYFLDFQKDDFELIYLGESNSYFSSLFLHINNMVFYLPVPYLLKQPFFFFNNTLIVAVDTVVKFFSKLINNEKVDDFLYNSPFEYFIVYKKIN